jgi:hypothetical protein
VRSSDAGGHNVGRSMSLSQTFALLVISATLGAGAIWLYLLLH